MPGARMSDRRTEDSQTRICRLSNSPADDGVLRSWRIADRKSTIRQLLSTLLAVLTYPVAAGSLDAVACRNLLAAHAVVVHVVDVRIARV
jgi:hypothetical protein